MKYLTEQIVFQEIPSEISLAFEITNCPRSCRGCHTPELQGDCGEVLTIQKFDQICEKYAAYDGKFIFTCVLFMGGEQHTEINEFLEHCRKLGLKTALYTGANSVALDVLKNLDYVKLGEYNEALGALGQPNTNQVLFQLQKVK